VHDVTYPAPWVAEDSDVDLRAHLGRWVAVGSGATVGADAQIDDSVIMAGSIVEPGARVVESILGFGVHIGAGATVQRSVFGEGASAGEGVVLDGAKVPAGTTVDTP
jgi:mannose-1-phosphate guanylyltransferase